MEFKIRNLKYHIGQIDHRLSDPYVLQRPAHRNTLISEKAKYKKELNTLYGGGFFKGANDIKAPYPLSLSDDTMDSVRRAFANGFGVPYDIMYAQNDIYHSIQFMNNLFGRRSKKIKDMIFYVKRNVHNKEDYEECSVIEQNGRITKSVITKDEKNASTEFGFLYTYYKHTKCLSNTKAKKIYGKFDDHYDLTEYLTGHFYDNCGLGYIEATRELDRIVRLHHEEK